MYSISLVTVFFIADGPYCPAEASGMAGASTHLLNETKSLTLATLPYDGSSMSISDELV